MPWQESEDRARPQGGAGTHVRQAGRLDVSRPVPPSHDPQNSLSERLAAVRAELSDSDDLLTIRTAFSQDTYVIAVYGELDVSTVPEVRRELIRAESTSASEIVIDLSALHFMDSTGVHLLVEAHSRSQSDGNRLRLLRGTSHVQRVLEICGMDRELPFLD
jgi:anti-anti-sigma factor